MLRSNILRVGLGLSLALFAVVARADLLDDTVRFDQAFIPALVLCSQNDTACQDSFRALLPAWARFKQDQAYQPGHGPQWNVDFTQIERALLNAKRWSDEGQYDQAFQALLPARATMRRLHERVGLDYYPDDLLAFEDALRELASTLKQVGEQSVPSAWEPVVNRYADLVKRWQAVAGWPLNPYQYGLDAEQAKRLKACLAREQGHLDDFGKALSQRNHPTATSGLDRLRHGYEDIYRLFGRFPEGS